MIDFGNHYYVAQIWVLSLGTYCPPREQRLLISCSPIPHHVIPEGPCSFLYLVDYIVSYS